MLGASRLAYLAKSQVVAAEGGGQSTFTLDDSNITSEYINTCYCGTNSSGKPVFLQLWWDQSLSGTGNNNYQLFTIDTDGTVTKGTMGSINSSNRIGNTRFSTEKDCEGAGYKNEASESNYGAVSYYDYTVAGWRARAFSIDVDNLTVTFGSEVTQTSQGTWDFTYVGGNKYVAHERGGNNDNYAVVATLDRSGTSITHNNEWTATGYGGGILNLKNIGFPDDKWVIATTLNNQDGIGINACKEYNNTFYYSGNLDNIVSGAFNCYQPSLAKMNGTDKFAVLLGNDQNSYIGLYLAIGEITWNTGTTIPSQSFGTVTQVDSTPNRRYLVLPDPTTTDAGKIFHIDNSGNLLYKNFVVSGTTPSIDSSWTDTGEDVAAVNQVLTGSAGVDSNGTLAYYVVGWEDTNTSNNFPFFTLVE